MRRRRFLAGTGTATATVLAGCGSDTKTDTEEGTSEPNGTDISPQETNGQEIPPPDERSYRSIPYQGVDIEDPSDWQSLAENAWGIEEEIDRAVYNSTERFPDATERKVSYVELGKIGTETRELDREERDSYEQNLLSLNVDLDVGESLDYSSAEDLSVATFELIGNVREERIFYNPELDENDLKPSAFAEVSLNIESENGVGEINYRHPEDAEEGQSIQDLSTAIDSYLDGSESAIQEEVEGDFNYE